MTTPPKTNWWLLAGVALVALMLRLAVFGTVPLWTDELFTRFYPRAGLSYLWGAGFRAEPTPPFYYSVIWAIEHLFGDAAWLLRLPSLAGSLATVGLAWALGRELFGRPGPALAGALLLTLAPINVFYAGEARVYALQAAALALALLGLARVLRGASGLLAYGIGALLALWLHPTSVLAVTAMNVAALAGLAADPATRRSRLWRWVLANALVAAACLPLLPGLLAPPDGGAATNWIPVLSRPSLESVIGETLAGPGLIRHAQGIAELSAVALVLIFALSPWRLDRRPDWRALIVLLLVPGLTLALMVGVSVVKPILLARTLAWLVVPLSVGLGGLLFRRPTIATRVIAAGVIGAEVVALCIQLAAGVTLKEDWPGLFARMGSLSPPALVVLAPHSSPGAFTAYGPAPVRPVRLDDGKPPMPETAVIPRLLGTETISINDLSAAIAAGRPVWLIYRRPEYAWVQQEIAGLPTPTRMVQSEAGSNPALRALYWSR